MRNSIQPTYDSQTDGDQYSVTTTIGDRTIGFEIPIADPFIYTKVTVNWWDAIKSIIFKGCVVVGVNVRGRNTRIIEDVMELDGNYLGQRPCSRRTEFDSHIQSALHEIAELHGLPERDSAWIVEGCREAWKDGGFEDKDRADERFRTKYQTFAVGWMESRMRLIGPTPDPDAHLTGEAYLQAKQERCATWMKGQSAEEIEREMRGEPSKAILTDERAMECARAMYSGDGDKMDAYAQGMRDARDNGYLSASYERDRAKLIETLQECVDLIHLSRYDQQWPPLLTDELLSKVKDTHGIEPQKD